MKVCDRRTNKRRVSCGCPSAHTLHGFSLSIHGKHTHTDIIRYCCFIGNHLRGHVRTALLVRRRRAIADNHQVRVCLYQNYASCPPSPALSLSLICSRNEFMALYSLILRAGVSVGDAATNTHIYCANWATFHSRASGGLEQKRLAVCIEM
jgi:hypothetical protein